jgi:hypothetical protein
MLWLEEAQRADQSLDCLLSIARHPRAPRALWVLTLDDEQVRDGSAEAELVKPDWFNTPKFPKATFTSTGVKALGGGRFEITGTLGIKGATQPVTVPVTLTQSGGATTANGAFTVKRLDFRIGDGEWKDVSVVANEVQVKFKLALTGVGPLGPSDAPDTGIGMKRCTAAHSLAALLRSP